jgi:hypothetical protein
MDGGMENKKTDARATVHKGRSNCSSVVYEVEGVICESLGGTKMDELCKPL